MNRFGFLAFFCLLVSCDDGDFNIPSFDFDGLTINNCGNLVLNKITTSGTETLIINLAEDNTDNIFFKTELDNELYRVGPNESHTMYYRIFGGSITTSYFCQDVPSSTPNVTEEWTGEGNLYITNTITLDDNDGVPIEIEKVIDPETGIWLDTDKDGYPDYIDIDDDGDNKLTINEDIDISSGTPVETGEPYNIDTDGDGIKNYLDTDDDDDGTPSIEESDSDDTLGNFIVDYLDNKHNAPIAANNAQTNNYTYSFIMVLDFESLTLTNDSGTTNYQDGYYFGTKSGSYTTSENPNPPAEETVE